MVHRFTEAARRVVVLAQAEARDLRNDYLGPEHILLGLLREEEGAAARTLRSLDITLDAVRQHVPRRGRSGDEALAETPFTPRSKSVLQLALREATLAHRGYVDTEHILLALASGTGGAAARILLDFDADPERVRAAVNHTLSADDENSTARGEGVSLSPLETDDHIRADRIPLAKDIRAARIRLKGEIREGTVDPVEIFLDPPAEAQTAQALELLVAVPGWGRVRAFRALSEAGIPLSKTVAALSDRQRDEVVAWLRYFGQRDA